MDIIGIICEYNPFHNGHLHHINEIRKMYKDSLIILVVSGYYTERGEISVITKEDKTKLALDYGVDIVLELPFVYSTQSADKFASYSLKILDELNVDYIVFGSECNDIKLLNSIVDKQINDSKYDENVKYYLDQGLNYPTAMSKALGNVSISDPNDLLGISYIKAIKTNDYDITPVTIKRTSDYHDTNSNEDIISASNIREKIKNNNDINEYVPSEVLDKITTIDENKLFELLKYKINTDNDLSRYLTVDEGIENKLKKVINECNNINELIDKIKTKRYTYNKINRMFIHILIGLLKSDNNLKVDYIRVLGFNTKGQAYLNGLKKDRNIPFVLDHESRVYEYELKASTIYDMLCNTNTKDFEIKNKPIIKK